jgi:hypothetical protein
MHPTDFCHYIDTKGKAHKAQVVTVRENRVLKATDGFENLDRVINDEPIISLSYVNPSTGRPETVSELVHMSHPSKQETNPAMPTIHLHCWKRTDEEHTAPAEDHPIFDHPHEQTKVDGFGKPIVKARPKHEAHIAAHQATFSVENATAIKDEQQKQEKLADEQRASDPVFRLPYDQGKLGHVGVSRAAGATTSIGAQGSDLPPSASAKLENYLEIGHPGHPETVHFDFECQSCGVPVKRVAHHQGGTMWEKFEASAEKAVQWVKHVCDPVKARAFSHKLDEPKEQHEAVAEAVTTEETQPAEAEKKLPVLSVLYSSPDITTYQGVKLVLPDGYEHIVKHNGLDQDMEDALRFAHVHGFPEAVVDQSIVNFREDKVTANSHHEPDVIAELQAAPPAPKEPETQKPEGAA